MNPIQGLPSLNTQVPLSPETSGKDGGFSSTLEDAMGKVQELQSDADQKVQALLDGNGQDIHGAMIAVQKADLSFQLMMQVRNKIVSAYQEVARMQF
jgi:flagellar hook-basal body complex protein FliE